MIRWILWRLTGGYPCDGCHAWVKRWRRRATPRVSGRQVLLYCPTCARKGVSGEQA